MGLLPWTFGLMLTMAIVSWASFRRLADETIIQRVIVKSAQERGETIAKKVGDKSRRAYKKLVPEDGAVDGSVADEEDDRPSRRSGKRLTTRLHIDGLFSESDGAKRATQEKIFKNLLHVLYDSVPLLSSGDRGGDSLVELFDEVRQRILDWGEKFSVHKAADLANVQLTGSESAAKQEVLFLILTGGGGELFDHKESAVPCLLSFLNAQKRDACMSVYLAPRALLQALFGNSDTVRAVIEYREELYRTIRSTKEPDKDLERRSAEFRAKFEPLLPSGIEAQFIDFDVSTSIPRR